MRKYFPYLVGLVVFVVLAVFLVGGRVSAAPNAQATATATRTATLTKTPRPTRTPRPTTVPRVRKFPFVNVTADWSTGDNSWNDIRSQTHISHPPPGCVYVVTFAKEIGGAGGLVIADASDEVVEIRGGGAPPVSGRVALLSVGLWAPGLDEACSPA